jgi:hypothetical protein
LTNDITKTLNNIQSTVIKELLKSGIKESEIKDDNDYLVQQEGENVLYRNNSVCAVFNDIYSSMRDGGGRPLGINVYQEPVYGNDNLTRIHMVTYGNRLVKLAEGQEENVKKVYDELNRLIGDESIKNLVKKSYTEARLNCKADEDETLKILSNYRWIPWSFASDIRRSSRDELTS